MTAAQPRPAAPFDAIVLAGGSARRLGGQDKPSLRVGPISLLDAVLAAVGHAEQTVVVGPTRPTDRPVVWTREDPHAGGPVAAMEAGLRLVRQASVVVVAADLPFLHRAAVDALLRTADGRDGAVLLDDDGREQWLVGAWSTAVLRRAVAASDHRGSVRRLVAALDWAPVALAPTPAPPWWDCDTDADLAWARSHAVWGT